MVSSKRGDIDKFPSIGTMHWYHRFPITGLAIYYRRRLVLLRNGNRLDIILNLYINQDYAFPILNIFVPHVGHTPWVAGFPFFIVMLLVSFISFLDRHLTQYACMTSPPFFPNTVWAINHYPNYVKRKTIWLDVQSPQSNEALNLWQRTHEVHTLRLSLRKPKGLGPQVY